MYHVSYLYKGNTKDQYSYLNDCLKPLLTALKKQRPTIGTKIIKFHHNTAKPHVAKSAITYLEIQKFLIMDHPPYSSDSKDVQFSDLLFYK